VQEPGLYFPFVHVRDDDWLKAAALYWPSVRRLVPIGYEKHDSPTAQTFVDAEVLRDEDPCHLLPMVSQDLARALEANADRLVQDYNLDHAYAKWDGRSWSGPSAPSFEVPQLGWIHVTKFSPRVLGYLSDLGLAVRGRASSAIRAEAGGPHDWIGLHPALAGAYMTVLAASVSKQAHFQPVTDQADLKVATVTGDIESALHLLTGSEARAGTAGGVGVETYVMLALRCVLPANLADVPADKIIECRRRLAEELAAFRDYVAASRAELVELAAIPLKRRRLEAFAEHVEHTVEVPLLRLERSLSLLGFEPARSLLVAGSFAAPAAVAAVVPMTPAAATTVGAVAAVGSAWWQVSRVRDRAKAETPVSYLLDVRDHLTPRTLAARVRRIFRGTYGRPKRQP